MAKLINEVAATVQPLVAKKADRLEVDCPADLGTMRSDQTKLRQVLFNLISNAAKFTEKWVVRLEVRRESPSPPGEGEASAAFGQPENASLASARRPIPPLPPGEGRGEGACSTFTFCVSDTGIGMTPEQLAKLFQAFTQADANTSKKFGGTGLGLALCKRFCEMMRSEIKVASEWGKGSTFTATLPVEVSTQALR